MNTLSRGRVTHQDIANHLGISRVAVTQALHQTRKTTISPELQARILQAARELNYRPSNVATYTIGYVGNMNSFALAAEGQYLMALDGVLREAGYRISLANVRDNDPEPLRKILTPKTVDGVIFSRWFDGRIRDLLPPEIPWIITSEEDGISDDVDQVSVDTVATARLITQHLLDHGHRRIALVTGLGEKHYHGHIKQGVQETIRQSKLKAELSFVIAVHEDREIREPFLKMLNAPEKPTAVIAISPEKTVAVLNLLQATGHAVPDDISVVSFLDSRLFEPLTPSITATTAVGNTVKVAVNRLMEKIHDPMQPAQKILLTGEIISRESVGVARPSG
jgi:LacI family transcriptional regulator